MKSSFSATDRMLLEELINDELAELEHGKTEAARNVLKLVARYLANNQPLPRDVALFIARRFEDIANDPAGPWKVALLKRSRTQSRVADKANMEFEPTLKAFLAVKNAQRGEKARVLEDEATRLGIDVRQLEARFKQYGLRRKGKVLKSVGSQ